METIQTIHKDIETCENNISKYNKKIQDCKVRIIETTKHKNTLITELEKEHNKRDWYKLEQHSNWGYRYYTINGEKVLNKSYKVLFPDRTISEHYFSVKEYLEPEYDWGRECGKTRVEQPRLIVGGDIIEDMKVLDKYYYQI